MTAIQIITVTWSKASRGGPAAAERNRIPRAFALQTHGGSSNVIQRHAFFESARGEFEERPVTCGQPPGLPAKAEGLLLEEAEPGGALVVGFSWDKNVHGMPNRGFKRRILVLARGETAQLRVNGRHSADGHWYTQHTFNLAHGDRPHERAFLDHPFTHSHNLEENLF